MWPCLLMSCTGSALCRVKPMSFLCLKPLLVPCRSILGMHIFGCKFSLKTEAGDTVPDRKNFDSLLWAIVTVFQVAANGFSGFTCVNKPVFHTKCYMFGSHVLTPVDPDSGGLERGAVQRHGVHLALCLLVFCSSYDLRELRALQFTGGHLGRGFPSRGTMRRAQLVSDPKGFALESLSV